MYYTSKQEEKSSIPSLTFKKFTHTLHPAQGPGATVARRALNRLAACLVVRLLTCVAAPQSLFHGAVPAKGHSTTRGHNVAVLRVIHKTLALFCSSTDVVYKCAHGCVPRMRCAGNSIAYDAFIYRMTLYRPYNAPQPHCQRQTTLMRRIQSPTESGSARSALVGADNIGEERDAENCKFENARGLCGY